MRWQIVDADRPTGVEADRYELLLDGQHVVALQKPIEFNFR